MNRQRTMLAAALAAWLTGGCATPTPTTHTDVDDKVYVTGSRIPKSDRSYSGVRATSDKNDINTMMNKGGTYTGGGGN
jgi:hypothetical protein